MSDSTDRRETGINLKGDWTYLEHNRLYRGKEDKCPKCGSTLKNERHNHAQDTEV